MPKSPHPKRHLLSSMTPRLGKESIRGTSKATRSPPPRVFGQNKSQRNGSYQIQVILAKFSNRLTDYTITDYLSKILKPINRLTIAHLLLQLIQFGAVQVMKKLLESPSGPSHTWLGLTLEAAHRNSLLIPPQQTCWSPTEEGRRGELCFLGAVLSVWNLMLFLLSFLILVFP